MSLSKIGKRGRPRSKQITSKWSRSDSGSSKYAILPIETQEVMKQRLTKSVEDMKQTVEKGREQMSEAIEKEIERMKQRKEYEEKINKAKIMELKLREEEVKLKMKQLEF